MSRPYTVAEAAALLHCSEYTIQEECRSGRLPGVKFGDPWILPAGALLARLDEIALDEAAKRRKPQKPAAVLQTAHISGKREKGTKPRPALPPMPTTMYVPTLPSLKRS